MSARPAAEAWLMLSRLKVIYNLLCGPSFPTTRDRAPVIEIMTPPALTLTNTYEMLARVPIHDTHVPTKNHAAKEASYASDGKASHLPAECPERSFGLKDDGLADMFEIYYAVTVSPTVPYLLEMQTDSAAEPRSYLHENQKGLGQGRGRLHLDRVRCLAYHCGSGIPPVSVQ